MTEKTRLAKVVGTIATALLLTSTSALTCGSANADLGAYRRLVTLIEQQIAKLGRTTHPGNVAVSTSTVLRPAETVARGDDTTFLRITRGACTVNSLQHRGLAADDFVRRNFPTYYEQNAVWAQSAEYRILRSWDENGHQYMEIVCDEVNRYQP